jgi:hypothetical protein
MKVIKDVEKLEKAMLWKYSFMDYSNLCLVHYDTEGGELDLTEDLLTLSKDKFLRCILGFELLHACMLSSAWINSTLDFRNRIEYGDLCMTNRPYMRNQFELLLCTLGGELAWPIKNPDATIGGFLKMIEPTIAVQLFKSRLSGLTGGTPDEVVRFVEEHIPRIRQNIESSMVKTGTGVKKGGAVDGDDDSRKSPSKNGKRAIGGGGAFKNKRGDLDEEKPSGQGEVEEGDKQLEKRVSRPKSEDPCLSHLGFLLGTYGRDCKYGAECGFTHKGITEVSKVTALASLAISKTPEKLVEIFKKAIEEKLT